MTHCIFCDKGKIKLGWYDYHRPADCFFYGFGTTSHTYRSSCDLDIEIIAELDFESIHDGWFVKYPENNTLTVSKRKNCDIELTEDLIKGLKGYKKFFKPRNINKILFK